MYYSQPQNYNTFPTQYNNMNPQPQNNNIYPQIQYNNIFNQQQNINSSMNNIGDKNLSCSQLSSGQTNDSNLNENN